MTPEDGARKQLEWLEEMERVEQEVFPDARPRSEVVVDIGREEVQKAGVSDAYCDRCGIDLRFAASCPVKDCTHADRSAARGRP